MKYIEEICPGDVFSIDNNLYILTIDFKKNHERLAIDLSNGSPCWFKPNEIVKNEFLYSLDQSNNIIPIKKHEKTI